MDELPPPAPEMWIEVTGRKPIMLGVIHWRGGPDSSFAGWLDLMLQLGADPDLPESSSRAQEM